MRVAFDDLLPGETPLDISYLLVPNIGSRAELSTIEGEKIFDVLLKYFGKTPPQNPQGSLL